MGIVITMGTIIMTTSTELLAQSVLREPERSGAVWDRCSLTYDARILRRRLLRTVRDKGFLVDLAKTVSVDHGDAFQLTDGRLIEVIAAQERLFELRSPDLVRLAWHIGNRHAPCQIEAGRLLIQPDHVLRGMLEGLGAEITEVTEPFTPEGGAYGMGRTLPHSHGPHDGHSHHDGHHHHDHEH
jgi:urease accessory protein